MNKFKKIDLNQYTKTTNENRTKDRYSFDIVKCELVINLFISREEV